MSKKSIEERFEKEAGRTHDQNRVPIERDNLRAFMKVNRVTDLTTANPLVSLIGKAAVRKSWMQYLSGFDHTTAFRTGNGVVLATQPYELNTTQIRGFLQLCDEHGLEMRLGGDSWHRAGATLLVTMQRSSPLSTGMPVGELVGAYYGKDERTAEMAGLIKLKAQIEARMVELDREMAEPVADGAGTEPYDPTLPTI